MNKPSQGPLAGIRIVEFAGLGPAPFAGMLLADLGADVVRIDRPGAPCETQLARGKRSIALALKDPDDHAVALALIARANALIEGFRPGVMERLGLGPATALATNPRLVYGRMTGWGQDGPLAPAAGHDINYLGLTGALHAIGEADRPPIPPLNLAADFGGGSLYLVAGLLAALLGVRSGGLGQVVDAAMVDGAASLAGLFHGLVAEGRWNDARGSNVLDGAAPFYRCYACADGRYVAVGAIEPQFWSLLCEGLGLDPDLAGRRDDRSSWPQLTAAIAARFMTDDRDAWCERLPRDACVSPVLSIVEAPHHPHNRARGTFHAIAGGHMPGAAPRFSATPAAAVATVPDTDGDRAAIIAEWLDR